MVRSISEKYYAWSGLQRTRAWREFAVLSELESQGLPAPKPYACRVQRQGLRYSASLITYYLPGVTLAERMCTSTLGYSSWRAIGATIKQFHLAGADHADLNAHNILLDSDNIFLIDFDRAVIRSTSQKNRFDKNLSRLKRSLNKIDSSGPAFYNADCWAALIAGYMQT
ncbi:UNVERIFIED_CONTAM: hypothetical protein GTU68_005750 [Idotea baltica]|nr:hypothetical protein [Idotea baltica]